jgi:hypothetical protein
VAVLLSWSCFAAGTRRRAHAPVSTG